MEGEACWLRVREVLSGRFSGDFYRTWFEPLRYVGLRGGCLTLVAPDEFTRIWVLDNYRALLLSELARQSGELRQLSIVVDESLVEGPRVERKLPKPVVSPFGDLRLNSKNTFANFVIGPSNEIAYAAATAVAENPAEAYNPLFLYGQTGLGKTHLIHAIAHYIIQRQPKCRLAYLSTEKFTNEYVEAIQKNQTLAFRRRYRRLDVLLVDDIQFLARKERIQEEFFHTFNELFEHQKQIILTSDRPAGDISKMESRLISRFQWGLPVDVQPPDYETRLAIIQQKSQLMKLQLSPDITQFIAQNISRNIRRIEGALNRLATYSAFLQHPLDLPSAQKALKDILEEEHKHHITIEHIQKQVAGYHQLPLADMTNRRRHAHIAQARQIAMYLSRELTRQSLQEIGQNFGGRDHGTVLHAHKTIQNLLQHDTNTQKTIQHLQQHILTHPPTT